MDTVEGYAEPGGDWKLDGPGGGIEDCALYMDWKLPEFIMGEPTGEKAKCPCSGPAELMMGSLSKLKVSKLKGRGGCCGCGCTVVGPSSE